MADGNAADSLPHDLDAERAVLGGILLDSRLIDVVSGIVNAGEFYNPAHASIFEAQLALASRGDDIDVVTVAAELRTHDRLSAVGGAQYLGELTDTRATTAHIEQHARLVADHASVRRTIFAGLSIAANGRECRRPREYLEESVRAVTTAAEVKSRSEPVHVSQVVEESYVQLETTVNRPNRISGITTGLRDLDVLISGMQKAQLIIVAARTRVGKTSLAMHMTVAAAAASEPSPTLFFSLEMPRVELNNRTMCSMAKVDQQRWRNSCLRQEDMDSLNRSSAILHKLPIWIDDSGDTGLDDIRAKSRKLKAKLQSKRDENNKKQDLGLVVIDHLSLMRFGDEERQDLKMRTVTRGLKRLAKSLEVPIVLLCQLNRSPDKRGNTDQRPRLADLRDSGSIEEDADVVLMIYRDELVNGSRSKEPGIAEISVPKQRNGPQDTVKTRFIRDCTRFEDLDDTRAPAPPPDNNFQDVDNA